MKAVSQKALRCAVVLAVALVTAVALPAQNKPYPTAAQLAPTPPMGWNSWNHFAGKVDEADVRAAAKAMVDSGMAAAGYKYIVIDDTWQGKRDAQGFIHPNSKFPDMPGLIQYVHSLGLKFGIYSSPGPQTCAGYEGSYGHVQQDAETYARWGVDYLKYDLCSYLGIMHKEAANNPAKALAMQQAAYLKMYKALAAAGRPIVFSLCQYGIGDVWKWGPSVGGNLWRTTGDIQDNYARMATIGFGQLFYLTVELAINALATILRSNIHTLDPVIIRTCRSGPSSPRRSSPAMISATCRRLLSPSSPTARSSPSIRTAWAGKGIASQRMARSKSGPSLSPAEPRPSASSTATRSRTP